MHAGLMITLTRERCPDLWPIIERMAGGDGQVRRAIDRGSDMDPNVRELVLREAAWAARRVYRRLHGDPRPAPLRVY